MLTGLVALGLGLWSVPAWADAHTSDGSAASIFPPGAFLLQAMALLIVVACVLGALKLYNAIRGGRIGGAWLWMLVAFTAFAVGQLILFGGQLGVIPMLLVWVDALRLISLALFFIGITQLRKLLA
jgi:hypothetical protein